MKKKRHTTEQIIRKLREAERLKGKGKSVGETCQVLEISEQTLYRWKAKYGGVDGDAIKKRARSPSQTHTQVFCRRGSRRAMSAANSSIMSSLDCARLAKTRLCSGKARSGAGPSGRGPSRKRLSTTSSGVRTHASR